jgi:ribosomal protein L37AE/L43A
MNRRRPKKKTVVDDSLQLYECPACGEFRSRRGGVVLSDERRTAYVLAGSIKKLRCFDCAFAAVDRKLDYLRGLSDG